MKTKVFIGVLFGLLFASMAQAVTDQSVELKNALIEPVSGRCSLKTQMVRFEVPKTQAVLTASLKNLLEMTSENFGESGLVNVIPQANLHFTKVTLVGGVAKIYLAGTMQGTTVCERRQIIAQITKTAKQFATVKSVKIYLKKLTPSSTVSQSTTKDWQIYQNNKYGFKFEYPKGWKIQTDKIVNSGAYLIEIIRPVVGNFSESQHDGLISMIIYNPETFQLGASGEKPDVISQKEIKIDGQSATRKIVSFGVNKSLSYKMNLKNNPYLEMNVEVFSCVGGTAGQRTDFNSLLDEIMVKKFKFTSY